MGGNGKTLEMSVRSIGDSLNRERGRETVNGWGQRTGGDREHAMHMYVQLLRLNRASAIKTASTLSIHVNTPYALANLGINISLSFHTTFLITLPLEARVAR